MFGGIIFGRAYFYLFYFIYRFIFFGGGGGGGYYQNFTVSLNWYDFPSFDTNVANMTKLPLDMSRQAISLTPW